MYPALNSINADKSYNQPINNFNSNKKIPVFEKEVSIEELKKLIKKELPEINSEQIQANLDRIRQISLAQNHDVKVSLNKEINRLIIHIMEKDTSRVIREFPCNEIQKLALFLKNMADSLNGWSLFFTPADFTSYLTDNYYM